MKSKKHNKRKWLSAQKLEESFWVSKEYIKYFHENKSKSKWSHRFSMFDPIDVDSKLIVEIGSFITGPIHDFDNSLKIGIEPLIDKFHVYRDKSVEYIMAVGESLPIRHNSAELIIIWNTLDHCLHPEKVLTESSLIISEKGRLLLSINLFLTFIPKILLDIVDRTHPYHYDKKSLIKLLKTRYKIIDDYSQKIMGNTIKLKFGHYISKTYYFICKKRARA